MRTVEEDTFTLTVQEQKVPYNPATDKGLMPLKIEWKEDTNEDATLDPRLYSFVCQAVRGSLSYEIIDTDKEYGADLYFTLDQEINVDDQDKAREFCFYVDLHDALKVLVSQVPATTFELGQEISIESRSCKFTLVLTLESGQGIFMGHMMRGNRPARCVPKENRFAAFDLQIFLRTLYREETCKIKAVIRKKREGDVHAH